METDRDYDLWLVEIELENERIIRQFLKDVLGNRGRRQQLPPPGAPPASPAPGQELGDGLRRAEAAPDNIQTQA